MPNRQRRKLYMPLRMKKWPLNRFVAVPPRKENRKEAIFFLVNRSIAPSAVEAVVDPENIGETLPQWIKIHRLMVKGLEDPIGCLVQAPLKTNPRVHPLCFLAGNFPKGDSLHRRYIASLEDRIQIFHSDTALVMASLEETQYMADIDDVF